MRVNTLARILSVGSIADKKEFLHVPVTIETPPRRNEFDEIVRKPEQFNVTLSGRKDKREKIDEQVEKLKALKEKKTLVQCALDLRQFTYKTKDKQEEQTALALDLKTWTPPNNEDV